MAARHSTTPRCGYAGRTSVRPAPREHPPGNRCAPRRVPRGRPRRNSVIADCSTCSNASFTSALSKSRSCATSASKRRGTALGVRPVQASHTKPVTLIFGATSEPLRARRCRCFASASPSRDIVTAHRAGVRARPISDASPLAARRPGPTRDPARGACRRCGFRDTALVPAALRGGWALDRGATRRERVRSQRRCGKVVSYPRAVPEFQGVRCGDQSRARRFKGDTKRPWEIAWPKQPGEAKRCRKF